MSFYEQAEEKIRKELPAVRGQKEGAIKQACKDALLDFAGQNDEFAQAIVQGGTFADCMAAVCKGIGTSISDLEVFGRAAAFYFPGCKVRFEMRIDLVGDADPCQPGPAEEQRKEEPKKSGLILNLADFL